MENKHEVSRLMNIDYLNYQKLNSYSANLQRIAIGPASPSLYLSTAPFFEYTENLHQSIMCGMINKYAERVSAFSVLMYQHVMEIGDHL